MLGWAVILASTIFIVIAYSLDILFKNRRQGRKVGIEVISRPANPKFDIVAVHGLGAHPNFSWTSKLSKAELEGELVEWSDLSTSVKAALGKVAREFRVGEKTRRISLLQHVLKPEFPEATILSFCYNSDWFINAPVVTAKQIGDTLLENLEKVRSANLSTPIIFIGHSFGGIVIKQALIAARETGKNDVVDRTRGIIFLGTPHHGSQLSRYAAMLAFVCGIFGSDTTLLYALRYGSEQLSELEECFRNLVRSQINCGGRLDVVSFREIMQTYIPGWLSIGLVVNASSALGYARETIPLNVDHGGLNKSPKVYKALTAEIHNIGLQSKPLLNPTQREVQKELRPLGNAMYDPEREESEEYETLCDPNTRVALLERIKKWITGMGEEYMFWLQGKAGTGKSTVSRTIIGDLIQEKQCIASFYFKRNTDCANPGQLFPSLASQLTQRLPSISKYVQENIHSPNAKSPAAEWKREEQFRKLILEPLGRIDDSEKPRTIVLIIDALDECNHQDDIKKILRVLPEAKQLRFINVKFLLTSRREDHIRAAMEKLDHWKGTVIDDESDTEHDISVFVRSRLKKIQAELKKPSDWPGEDKITKLIQLIQPLFIFAWTACRFIGDQRAAGTPEKRLKRILEQKNIDYKSQIAATYLPVLDQMVYGITGAHRDERIVESKRIIGAIIVSFTPFSADSLAKFLDIEIEIIDSVLNLLHSVLKVPSDQESPITLFHQSFRDFLLGSDLAKDFSIKESEVHDLLYGKCLDTMMNYLKEDLCSQRKPSTRREDIDDEVINRCLKRELQYACLYWVEHLQKSSPKIDDIDRVHLFLKKHFLHWLEALGWMGKVLDGIQFIISLESVAPAHESSNLLALLLDMKSFVRNNRAGIELAPLQVYSSALALAPVECKVRKQYSETRPSWVQQVHGTSKTYDRAIQTLVGHCSLITAVAFSQDGKYLASASYEGFVCMWKVELAVVVANHVFHDIGSLEDMRYSESGKWLALRFDTGKVWLWNFNSTEVPKELTNKDFSVSAIAFSTDSDELTLACDDGILRMWNGSVKVVVKLDSSCSFKDLKSVTFSPDGKRLAAGPDVGSVLLWESKSGKLLNSQEEKRLISEILFSQDSKRLISISEHSEVTGLLDGKSGELVAALKSHISGITSIAFSSDGKWLASASERDIIKLWNAKSGVEERTIAEKNVSFLGFTTDSRWLASGSFNDGIKLWNHKSGDLLNTLEHTFLSVDSSTFSPDGKWLAIPSIRNGVIRLWDYKLGTEMASSERHNSLVTHVAFSQEGDRLASASRDGNVKLWDCESGRLLHALEGHTDLVSAVAFSPDDRWLASASFDKTIRFWDSKTTKCLKTFNSNHVNFYVTFSPDGKQLASATYNGPVNVWDVESRTLLVALKALKPHSKLVAFSPDSRRLASYNFKDNIYSLWDTKDFKTIDPIEGAGMYPQQCHCSDGSYYRKSIYHGYFTRTGWASGSISKTESEQEHFSLSVSKDWIRIGKDKFFYLPSSFEPSCVAIKGQNIALGHEDGRITILRFNISALIQLVSSKATG